MLFIGLYLLRIVDHFVYLGTYHGFVLFRKATILYYILYVGTQTDK